MSSEDDMSEGEEEMKMEREVLMQGCIFSSFNQEARFFFDIIYIKMGREEYM